MTDENTFIFINSHNYFWVNYWGELVKTDVTCLKDDQDNIRHIIEHYPTGKYISGQSHGYLLAPPRSSSLCSGCSNESCIYHKEEEGQS